MELVEWQIIDSDNGIVFPWWTHPFLNELKTWELSDKSWLEFGAGLSTSWLRSKCKWVDSIEANVQWADRANKYCLQNNLINGNIYCREVADGVQDQKQFYFDMIPKKANYDIISVDGIWRYECLQWALDHFKGRGGVLIADNWDQDYVWISPPAEQLMVGYPINIFVQPNHTNHEGRPWKTVYWNIPA